MSLEQEQMIEHLQRTNSMLSNALRVIDDQVDFAIGKYLKSTVPVGKLKFAEFIDLLALEMRRHAREEVLQNRKAIDTLPGQIKIRFQALMEAKAEEMLPVLKGRIADYVTIPILIQPKTQEVYSHQRGTVPVPYYAMPLRGAVRQAIAETPLLAYESLRARLVLELFDLGPKELIHSLTQVKTLGTDEKYVRAKPFKTEVVEGFTLVSRLLEESK